MNGCLFCGKSLSTPLSLSFILSFKRVREPMICKGCLNQFNRIDLDHACLGCSRPQKDQILCMDCQRWKREYPDLTLNHSTLFTYNEMAREYMKAFKFQGDLVLAELFAEKLGKTLTPYQKTHHIVPIPISEESMKVRGFSQVNLMLEKTGIACEDWLIHTGEGQRQSTKNRTDRLLSKQFLTVNLAVSEAKQLNKPILIVDDVYTTGRTIMHAKNAFTTFFALSEKIETKKRMDVESFSLFR